MLAHVLLDCNTGNVRRWLGGWVAARVVKLTFPIAQIYLFGRTNSVRFKQKSVDGKTIHAFFTAPLHYIEAICSCINGGTETHAEN